MIGIDYNKAKVDIRAMFSFTKKNATAAMERLKKISGIQGCVILSTCNRMELWASTKADWDGTLLEELCKIKEVDPTQYGEYFVERKEEEAVDHLFHLTSGLKSMILAEDQIITQVKDALTLARDAFVTDNVLEVLFRKAVTAGKKVKTNVIFSRANQTAMDQAIEMLKERNFPFVEARCMVIGNGEMGKVAAQTLRDAGANVTVTVRQYRSGMVSIPIGCSRIHYGERMNFLPKCDVVVSATASPNYTLRRELFDDITLTKPLLLLDLAVPRDIEPALGGEEGVTLYDMDSFRTERISPESMESITKAGEIVRAQMDEFFQWLDGRDVIPRIQEIREDAVQDLNLRIHKILKNTPMDDSDRANLLKAVDTAAGKVVNKLIFGLRDSLEQDTFLECVAGLEKLYEE